MFNTEITQGEDAGVSPVIGVILMVAITVILAAVIGTFVLDLAGGLNQNAQASVTFDEDTTAGTVDVRAVSMQNADSLTVQVTDNTSSNKDASVNTNFSDPTSVGDTATVETLEEGDVVTVKATLDGNTTVIQTHTFG